MISTTKIAVLGAGNMGKSLIGGLVNHHFPPNQLWATALDKAHLDAIKKQFHVHTTSDNFSAANEADVIILAVKPKQILAVAESIKATLRTKRRLIISVAAGILTANISSILGEATPIVRAMPNVPALVGKGATVLYANQHVTQEERLLVEKILSSVGITEWIDDEKMLNSLTALSGCGPAYFFLLMDALFKAAEKLAIPKTLARTLILQNALGAAHYAKKSDEMFDEIIKHIASPGGSTEKALAVLNAHHLTDIVSEALIAANTRAIELSQGK